MKQYFFTLLLLLGFGLMSCSSISVRTDYDRDVSFTKYQTFKWMPNPKKKRGKVPPNSLLDKRIRIAVETEMEAKGYRFIKEGKPDALIAYHVGVQNKVDINRYGYGYGYWGRRTHVRRYKEGSIIIDVVDPEIKQMVWRGAAQGIVGHPDGDPEKIQEAIFKIFEKYPPS